MENTQRRATNSHARSFVWTLQFGNRFVPGPRKRHTRRRVYFRAVRLVAILFANYYTKRCCSVTLGRRATDESDRERGLRGSVCPENGIQTVCLPTLARFIALLRPHSWRCTAPRECQWRRIKGTGYPYLDHWELYFKGRIAVIARFAFNLSLVCRNDCQFSFLFERCFAENYIETEFLN